MATGTTVRQQKLLKVFRQLTVAHRRSLLAVARALLSAQRP
jgi:hypothetical protein